MAGLSTRSLIAAATAMVGLDDESQEGVPRGLVSRVTGLADLGALDGGLQRPWDAAFVQHCGYWAHYDCGTGRSTWPIVPQATANDLAAFGREHGVLCKQPKVGDILLLYTPVGKLFVRSGIVADVEPSKIDDAPYFDILSIEGNTGTNGAGGGPRTLCIKRRVSGKAGDRFLRWVKLERRSRNGLMPFRDQARVAWARRSPEGR